MNKNLTPSHAKSLLMKSSLRPWQLFIVAILTTLNAYAIAEGLKYNSFLGVMLALASLTTLGFCIRLFKTMNKANAEPEDTL